MAAMYDQRGLAKQVSVNHRWDLSWVVWIILPGCVHSRDHSYVVSGDLAARLITSSQLQDCNIDSIEKKM